MVEKDKKISWKNVKVPYEIWLLIRKKSANDGTKMYEALIEMLNTSTTPTPTAKTKKQTNHNPLGAEIVKAFEEVDPKNKQYYGNTTQRKACDFLLEEYGLEEVVKRIKVLPQTNKIPFFPSITTPVQLRDKWVQLHEAVNRKRAETQVKKPTIV